MHRQPSQPHQRGHGGIQRGSGWLRRRPGRTLVLAVVVAALAMPAPIRAEGCGARDLAACVNAAQYAFWLGVAGEVWSANRVLLTLAYQLDVFRDWLIATVFTSIFQIVADTISPALVPMAAVAVLIGVLCFLLMPVVGRIEIVNIRRALIWIVVAPLLLLIAGDWLARAEQLRTTMGQTLFTAAQQVGSAPRFGAQAGEMHTAAASLYPFNGCQGGVLERPFAEGGSSDGRYIDDLAAAMLYADAEDIHCPLDGSGPGTELPDGFYSPAEGGPAGGGGDYATTKSVSTMSSSESAEWVRKIQAGVTRLLMGLAPSFLAVMNAVIQLLFALALVLLFIALPLGLLVVFFTDTAAGVTGLARRMVSVLQTSWSSSLLLGIVFVALLAASNLGNVAAFVGLSIAGIFLTLFVIFIAVHAFMSSVRAIAQTVGQTVSLGTGISASVAGMALGGTFGAMLAPGRAAQTAGRMGLDYTIARRAGTSRRYAGGVAAARMGAVSRVGELASTLGMHNDITEGIYTGQRGARSRDGYRMTRRLAEGDAARRDAAGLTMREREEARDLQWAAERARRGSNVEEASRIVGRGIRAVLHPVPTTRAGARAASPGVERVKEVSGDIWRSAWERARAARDSVVERAGDPPTGLGTTAAVVMAASHGFTRDARSGRVAGNGRGGITFLARVPDAQLPPYALHEPVGNVNEGRLLQLGHHLQYNQDGTVSFWHPDGPDTPQPEMVAHPGANTSAPPGRRTSGAVQIRSQSVGAGSLADTPAAPSAAPAPSGAATPPMTGGASAARRGPPVVPPARRSRVYSQPTPSVAPTPTWIEQHGRAVDTLTRARTRLALLQRGALAGSEAEARQAVAAAEQRVASVLWISYQPGEAAQAGIPSPVPEMLREAADSDQALTVNPQGAVVPLPLLQATLPPPETTLVLAADEVRDSDGLLAAGYQLYQPPDRREIIAWPRADAPNIRWIDPGTSNAQIDQAGERRRLARQGLITAPPSVRPRPVRAHYRQVAASQPAARRRSSRRRRP